MATADVKLSRLRAWIVALAVVVVFAAFAAPLAVIWIQSVGLASNQLAVTCTIVRAQNTQLLALEQVRHELGLPGELMIPEVPPECDGF